MRYRDPLKQILSQTRSHWDHDQTRPAVRREFSKALLCRTPTLGAQVYASGNEEKVVYHTCKGRACPSCGHQSTLQWQRERWAALPDVPYKGITFTMPDVLWRIFRDNRQLTKALPVLAANLIQTWVRGKYGLRVGVIAILHTFNGRLEFNSHVHTMVTAGGVRASGTWQSRVYYDRDSLMKYWREGIIRLIRAALRAGLLHTEVDADAMESLLIQQEQRWWSINIQSLGSKEHFLRYAGRYARRPPIAQRRITQIEERNITFWAKDKKTGRRVELQRSPKEFIDSWSQHIPERYQHAIRWFGLFAPHTLGKTSKAVFAILGQKQIPRPIRVPWAISIKRDFGWDPLLDHSGQRMKLVRIVPPDAFGKIKQEQIKRHDH